jgi:putative oxidoreductase
MGESFGALGLIMGLLTRFSAFGMLCIMLGAIAMVHWPNGFFMNWFGKQAGEGFEYHLLVIGMSLALMVAGAGKWSVDGAIAKKLQG